jgi:hypothetical protein
MDDAKPEILSVLFAADSDGLNTITEQIIGAAFLVLNTLGCGFSKKCMRMPSLTNFGQRDLTSTSKGV